MRSHILFKTTPPAIHMADAQGTFLMINSLITIPSIALTYTTLY